MVHECLTEQTIRPTRRDSWGGTIPCYCEKLARALEQVQRESEGAWPTVRLTRALHFLASRPVQRLTPVYLKRTADARRWNYLTDAGRAWVASILAAAPQAQG